METLGFESVSLQIVQFYIKRPIKYGIITGNYNSKHDKIPPPAPTKVDTISLGLTENHALTLLSIMTVLPRPGFVMWPGRTERED